MLANIPLLHVDDMAMCLTPQCHLSITRVPHGVEPIGHVGLVPRIKRLYNSGFDVGRQQLWSNFMPP